MSISKPYLPTDDLTQVVSVLDTFFGRLQVAVNTPQFPGFSNTSLPDPSEYASVVPREAFSSIIFIYDYPGGAILAYSDGTSWLQMDGTPA